MYLKTNTIFTYRRAQIRSFQDECDGNRVVSVYSGPWLHKVSACVNIPVTLDAREHEWRLESGWGLTRAVSSHQCRMA